MTFSDGSESTSSTGMRVGITAGNYVSTSVPLYVDYGVNINYIWDDIEGI